MFKCLQNQTKASWFNATRQGFDGWRYWESEPMQFYFHQPSVEIYKKSTQVLSDSIGPDSQITCSNPSKKRW